jgi:hypothetical protein
VLGEEAAAVLGEEAANTAEGWRRGVHWPPVAFVCNGNFYSKIF